MRPFGDNGREAENWSVNMLYPYAGNVSLTGNVSLIGEAITLARLENYHHKGLFVIGFEHSSAKISLDPLINSFDVIARQVMNIGLGERIEEKRKVLCIQNIKCFVVLAGS